MKLSELAEKINAKLTAGNDVEIAGINSIDAASNSELTYAEDDKNILKLADSQAAAVILSSACDSIDKPQLIVDKIGMAVIDVLNIFAPKLTVPSPGIHPAAVVDRSAKIAPTASIGPNCAIEANAVIGENCVVKANCFVGENTQIGENTILNSNVSVYHNCVIGKNCVMHSGAVIGANGFGYEFIDGQHKFIPHNGGVIIEDCVDIGANACVDRAKFGNTKIGAGTKIDNLVSIAHNVTVGKCSIIIAFAGIAGSTKIGNGVVIAGQVGIAGHLNIGDGVTIGAQSGVMQDIEPGLTVVGAPPLDVKAKFREFVCIAKLPDMMRDFKKLKRKVDKLDKSENN